MTSKPDPGEVPDEPSLRLLVGTIRDYAIFMLDTSGHVTTWNAGARAIKGYEASEIIGKHIRTFYTPEQAEKGYPEELLRRAAEEGRVEDEGWRVRKDGTRFWADVVITALHDETTGRLVGYAKVTRDLSDRRAAFEKLRLSETRFRILLDGLLDHAIFMLDPRGVVASWNPAAERIKGYKASEIIGRHFSVFYTEEDNRAGKTAMELEVATREGRFEDEGWRVRKDGSRFWANVVITALHGQHGELIGFAKVTRDLTQRKKLDEERLELARAREAVRLRDEFLSIASHELKTPLTALILQVQALEVRLNDAAQPVLATRAHRARENAERLAELVESLLDVTRISKGLLELQSQPVDVDEVVREVVERMAETASLRGSEIRRHTEPVTGLFDRLRVEQALMNLLANAIKYAPGKPIDVTARQQGEQVVLEVRDRGPGIPESEQARIFERYERAASKNGPGGLGLGLYVARQIAEAHGGTVAVRNEADGGATFSIALPLTGQPRI